MQVINNSGGMGCQYENLWAIERVFNGFERTGTVHPNTEL